MALRICDSRLDTSSASSVGVDGANPDMGGEESERACALLALPAFLSNERVVENGRQRFCGGVGISLREWASWVAGSESWVYVLRRDDLITRISSGRGVLLIERARRIVGIVRCDMAGVCSRGERFGGVVW